MEVPPNVDDHLAVAGGTERRADSWSENQIA